MCLYLSVFRDNEGRSILNNQTWGRRPTNKRGLQDSREHILSFSTEALRNERAGEDYTELLELTVILFLGSVPPRGIKFRALGAMGGSPGELSEELVT